MRVAMVIAVMALGIVLLAPSIDYYRNRKEGDSPTKDNTIWPHKVFNLGLDLQGGMHLVMEVQTEKAVETMMERKALALSEALRKARIAHKDVERVEGDKISLTLLGPDAETAFRALLSKDFPELVYTSRVEGQDRLATLSLVATERDRIMKGSVEQATEIIRNRVDTLGVTEPQIRRQGERRILIELPGVKDPQRAKDIIGTAAQLEFKIVDDEHDASQFEAGERLPRGTEILEQEKKDRDTGVVTRTPILVKKKTLMTGDTITKAEVKIDNQYGRPIVSIQFNSTGAAMFERITGANVQKRLAIVLDGVVKSAPVIKEKIGGGSCIIEGSFTDAEAHDLVIVLRTALPAPVKAIEERIVGPSLGRDSIRSGVTAAAVGTALVFIFMAVYYMGAGLAADFALILNTLLIGAGLAAFSATLTLPGIAGVILTLGMAVDANVLINERIREELRMGKTVAAALDAGYGRAMHAIVDSNVTTIATALILFQFGTGPIKGFAVTLILGLLSSLFTAIVVTRIIFDWFVYYRRVKKLSI